MRDFIESLVFCIVAVALAYLYCKATPDQMSAECDWARAEMEAASK